MKQKTLLILGSIFLLLFLTGCAKSISEIKSEEYVDEKVTVRGVVTESLKLGDLSGYGIEDENGDSIFVSSNDLPEDDSKVLVRGTLKKNILGYYIDDKN